MTVPSYNIGPAGDSITDGVFYSTDGGGYRTPENRLALQHRNFTMTYSGDQARGPTTIDGTPVSNHHEGIIGIKAKDYGIWMVHLLTAPDGPADIVQFLIGTNDVIAGDETVNQIVGYIDARIDVGLSYLGNRRVIGSTITPLLIGGSLSAGMALNTALRTYFATKQAACPGFTWVDIFASWPPAYYPPSTAYMDSDGIHPNEAGYTDILAPTWFAEVSRIAALPVVAGYILGNEVGDTGYYTQVFKSQKISDGTILAVKVSPTALLMPEYAKLIAISNANVILPTDLIMVDDGRSGMVMPLALGSAQTLISSITPAIANAIETQLLVAIAQFSSGHGNVSPHNVLISSLSGPTQIKLADPLSGTYSLGHDTADVVETMAWIRANMPP